jgi:phosphate-selective porin OprO/OprP
MNLKAVLLAFIGILTALAFGQAQTAAESSANTSGPARHALSAYDPAAVQPLAAQSAHAAPVSFRRDGLWFSTADRRTYVQIHGYAQADDRWFVANTHGEPLDTFLFRRIRPLFEGTLFNNIDFRFMPDFGQSNPQIQEAFLELKTLPFAKVRVGKFKEPIGLEVLRQDRDLSFPERSLASDLVPLRYIGAQVAGSVLSNSIAYAAGYFNGSNDGSNAVFTQWSRGNEAAARVFLHPFAKTGRGALRQFGVGVGGSAGSQHGSIAGLKTTAQTTFFKYSSTAVANGQHNRIAPQAYYYVGPFGLLGEYVISSQEVLNQGISGRIRNEAWQIAGSVVLTGEKNGYAGIHARNAFEPNRGFGHFGALELAYRYSQVRIDADAFPHFANPATAAQFAAEQGIGLNWYLTRYIKLTTDYEHTGFRMASKNVKSLHRENVLMSRLQLSF